jgi:hypothetical protein
MTLMATSNLLNGLEKTYVLTRPGDPIHEVKAASLLTFIRYTLAGKAKAFEGQADKTGS